MGAVGGGSRRALFVELCSCRADSLAWHGVGVARSDSSMLSATSRGSHAGRAAAHAAWMASPLGACILCNCKLSAAPRRTAAHRWLHAHQGLGSSSLSAGGMVVLSLQGSRAARGASRPCAVVREAQPLCSGCAAAAQRGWPPATAASREKDASIGCNVKVVCVVDGSPLGAVGQAPQAPLPGAGVGGSGPLGRAVGALQQHQALQPARHWSTARWAACLGLLLRGSSRGRSCAHQVAATKRYAMLLPCSVPGQGTHSRMRTI